MRAALEQEHVAPALRELAGDDTAARTRADDDHVEVVLHAIPRYDQSFARRVACGELKSISAHAPGPSLPGATKSLVVRLDRERPDEAELRRPRVLRECLGAACGRGSECVDRGERAFLNGRAASPQ